MFPINLSSAGNKLWLHSEAEPQLGEHPITINKPAKFPLVSNKGTKTEK